LYRPEKEEKERTRMCAGGNRINFPGDAGTPTSDLLTIKLLVNSIVSTKNAKMVTMDLKDFYLNTPMERPEFIQIKMSDIPEDVIHQYKLQDIVKRMGTSTAESKKACMDYHKRASSRNNVCKLTLPPTAITSALLFPACIFMRRDPSLSEPPLYYNNIYMIYIIIA
jgi:hypothetical protein